MGQALNQPKPAAHLPPSAPAVPADLLDFLASDLPDWQLVERADYDPSFWALNTGGEAPFVATTDLNDDGLADHCVLLKLAGYAAPFFFMGRKDGHFDILRQDAFRIPFSDARNDLRFGLSVEAPGQIDVAVPEIKSLVLRSNGVNLMEQENRWCIFYWDEGTIRSFTCR